MKDPFEQLKDGTSALYSLQGPFMKKDSLTHEEILNYEHLTVPEINTLFHKLGITRGAQLFYLMVQSYKILTKAANGGWGFLRAFDDGDSKSLGEATKELRRALHDYAPNHFSPHVDDLEFAADCFEQFYDEASKTTTREQMEELVFQWTQKLRTAAGERRIPRPHYEDIIAEYKRKIGTVYK